MAQGRMEISDDASVAVQGSFLPLFSSQQFQNYNFKTTCQDLGHINVDRQPGDERHQILHLLRVLLRPTSHLPIHENGSCTGLNHNVTIPKDLLGTNSLNLWLTVRSIIRDAHGTIFPLDTNCVKKIVANIVGCGAAIAAFFALFYDDTLQIEDETNGDETDEPDTDEFAFFYEPLEQRNNSTAVPVPASTTLPFDVDPSSMAYTASGFARSFSLGVLLITDLLTILLDRPVQKFSLSPNLKFIKQESTQLNQFWEFRCKIMWYLLVNVMDSAETHLFNRVSLSNFSVPPGSSSGHISLFRRTPHSRIVRVSSVPPACRFSGSSFTTAASDFAGTLNTYGDAQRVFQSGSEPIVDGRNLLAVTVHPYGAHSSDIVKPVKVVLTCLGLSPKTLEIRVDQLGGCLITDACFLHEMERLSNELYGAKHKAQYSKSSSHIYPTCFAAEVLRKFFLMGWIQWNLNLINSQGYAINRDIGFLGYDKITNTELALRAWSQT